MFKYFLASRGEFTPEIFFPSSQTACIELIEKLKANDLSAVKKSAKRGRK
jgi:hypothetical protein